MFAFFLVSAAFGQNARSEDSLFQIALKQHYGVKPKHLSYQGLSERIDSTLLSNWVGNVKNTKDPTPFLDFLNPDFPEFTQSLTYRFHPDYAKLAHFQNFYRWTQRFHAERFVLINIAANELVFYEKQQPILRMNVIVGTRKNQTPTMATVADAVIVYPYWTATRNIALNEILPKVQQNVAYLRQNNFEVINDKGKVINPYAVDWSELNTSNFNYRFRQGTGCENALGLMKINIQNPYSVYMHDTPHTENSQSLFQREKRFFSHGCIRLQKPLELANLLRPSRNIDQQLMEYCKTNEIPEVIELKEPVPVFVMYFTDYIDQSGEWKSVEDHYGWMK